MKLKLSEFKLPVKDFNSRLFSVITLLFITAKLLLHFFTNTRYELLRDEMLFFNMGDHLSWGYATVPPLTGVLAYIMKALFGFSVFGIRLFPALMGAASVWLISRLVKELGGGVKALVFASVSYLLSPGFLIVGTLFTPNAFDELIWLLATLFIFRMVKTGDTRFWIPIGIILAIGFLNKYSVLFFVAGFFLAMLFSDKRKLLSSAHFILSLLISLAIIAPNIIWQYNHGWPVIIHMNELKTSQLEQMGWSAFPVSLYAFNQGTTVIWAFALLILLISKSEKQFRLFGVASLIILLLFFLLQGKGYYALGIVPFLFAFGGYAMEKYLTGKLSVIKYSVFAITVLMSIAAMPSGLPVLSYNNYDRYIQKTKHFILHPLLEWDNGTQHNFSQAWADMTGWKELVGYVAQAYNLLSDEEKKTCTIYGQRNYGYAGAVYFYGKEYNLPEAITFHESYVFWAPDSIPDGPLIYIFRNINDLDQLFSDIELIGTVDNEYFRERGLGVYLCRNPKTSVPEVYRRLAAEEKSKFKRGKE